MFRIAEDPSSGSLVQCLAKITKMFLSVESLGFVAFKTLLLDVVCCVGCSSVLTEFPLYGYTVLYPILSWLFTVTRLGPLLRRVVPFPYKHTKVNRQRASPEWFLPEFHQNVLRERYYDNTRIPARQP